MRISNSEQIAIQETLAWAEAFGYGNLITHLQTAWAAKLMYGGISEKAARAATMMSGGMPFLMQHDLIEQGEWDETVKRYQKAKTSRARTSKKRGSTGARKGQA